MFEERQRLFCPANQPPVIKKSIVHSNRLLFAPLWARLVMIIRLMIMDVTVGFVGWHAAIHQCLFSDGHDDVFKLLSVESDPT